MFTQFFGNFLLKKGVIDAEQLLTILQNQNNVKIKLGTLAMCEGYMTASEVEKIHILQTHVDKKFGELAIEEGYLTEFLDQHKQEVTTMLSELFDEQAQREQYDKAIRKESEERGVLKTLVSLFKKGLLTLSEASKQADMSEKEFEDLVVSMS